MINSQLIRKYFPIFQNQPELVYLDSSATSLKPKPVIEAMDQYYQNYSANIFRGIYKISEKATYEYELTRKKIKEFINADSQEEIFFTRNTTESLNLIAYSWGRNNISSDDEIITTITEHHSNFVPWQQLAFENQAVFKIVGIKPDGELNLGEMEKIITNKTKIFALTHVSNVLGTVNPIKKIISQVRKINPKVIIIVDGAQAIPHERVDVKDLDCDFYAFSSHKMLGPTGVGVLWGRRRILQQMSPFLFGGEMIKEVRFDNTLFADLPYKFEAGTPDIAGVIGFGKALEYLQSFTPGDIREHEKKLVDYCLKKMNDELTADFKIVGPANRQAGIIAFHFDKIHAHDIAQVLDENNICVRAGHHCAMPLHQELGLTSTIRASFYIYNSIQDVDKFISGLRKAIKLFS